MNVFPSHQPIDQPFFFFCFGTTDNIRGTVGRCIVQFDGDLSVIGKEQEPAECLQGRKVLQTLKHPQICVFDHRPPVVSADC